MEDKVTLKTVESKEDIDQLAGIADRIWHEYFPSIISDEQIDYMVDLFLAPHSITKERKEGYLFYLLYAGAENIGFIAVRPEKNRLFLSKLYVDKEHRGQGFSNPMFEKAVEIAASKGLNTIYLTVNKNNLPAIRVYQHKGFKITESVKTDIGGGFVMDDYIMEWKSFL